MRAIFVTQFAPKPVGHGGDHRAYQIMHDLQQTVGEDNVVVASVPLWHQCLSAQQPGHPTAVRLSIVESARSVGRRLILPRLAYRALRRLHAAAVARTARFLPHSGSVAKLFSSRGFTRYYDHLVRDIDEPAVCVIEHVGFGHLVAKNARRGIPTISCIANIESFDGAAPVGSKKRQIYLASVNFADEFRVLAQCDHRLFISKVETALIGGLGLPSHYYPYIPVAAIQESAWRIRQARAQGDRTPGLFLMLGTAGHRTTRDSLSWFVESARASGLPQGTRVVVGGARTDELLPAGVSVPGVELRGWIEQEELDRLLTEVQAVLLPQRSGFGALTRLPELACAGVPAIVSRHPVYALDPPPGLHIVDDTWDSWCRAMEVVSQGETFVSEKQYRDWEEQQASTLPMVVEEALAKR
jgi:glycosyltransferase involved in cell wall biosynthesis